MKKTLFLLFCLLVSASVVSQNTAQKIVHCYVHQDIVGWKAIVDSLEALPNKTVEQRAEVLNYEYGYVAWRLSEAHKDKKEAEVYLEKAYANLHALPKTQAYKALIAAYEGAFVGYKIGISPYKAPFIGLKSVQYVKEAVQADDANYFAHIQYANVFYYMPTAFGGSRSEAVKHFLKAKQLMVTQGVHQDNWLYMNLLLTLADAYKKDQDWKKVKACYDEALQLQPDYPYIVNQLYPTLQKSLVGH